MAKAAPAGGSEAKKNAIAVVLFLAVGGIYYKNFLAKPSGSKGSPNASAGERGGASPRPGQPPGAAPAAAPAAGKPAGPGAPPVSAPPPDPNAQITIRPSDIPQLSDEVKRKLQNRGGGGNGIYPDVKVAAGSNPFLSFDVDQDKLDAAGGGTGARPGPGGKKRAPKFTKAMKFWGAFAADEETRAIVEVEGASIPWTGRIGENIDDTPFVLSEVSPDGRFVKLFDPNDPESAGVTLWFEGAKDGAAKATTGASSGLFKQPDAGGRD